MAKKPQAGVVRAMQIFDNDQNGLRSAHSGEKASVGVQHKSALGSGMGHCGGVGLELSGAAHGQQDIDYHQDYNQTHRENEKRRSATPDVRHDHERSRAPSKMGHFGTAMDALSSEAA